VKDWVTAPRPMQGVPASALVWLQYDDIQNVGKLSKLLFGSPSALLRK
jgi:hypothetical protein